MRLATSTNLLFARTRGARVPAAESIRACAAAGFRWLDFGFVEHAQLSARFHSDEWRQELAEIKQMAAGLGVGFVQAHATLLDYCNPGEDYEQGLALLRRSIKGAALLGAPWVVVHPSTGVENGAMRADTHEENVAFLWELAGFAQQHGIGLAVENMWGTTPQGVARYAIRPQQLAQLVDDIGCPNVGACWDTEHGSAEGLNQGEAIRLLGHRLKATHISDEAGPGCVHVLPYTGVVDWDDVLAALAATGYTGPFAFEMQHYLRGMPLPLVPQAMRLCVEVGQFMIKRAAGFSAAGA